MPDQPNWQEMGKPAASDGEKETVAVYDERYGKYQPFEHKHTTDNPASKLDPKPFAVK